MNLPQATDAKIPVTEMYVDVLQGEGASVGTPCSFLRLTGCDLTCEWCDSKHTWKPGQIVTSKKSVGEIAKFFKAGRARKLVFTGGEPLMHQSKLYFGLLIDELETGYRWTYEVETNGLHSPTGIVQDLAEEGRLQINCSPKLKNAGMGDLSQRYTEAGVFTKIFALGGYFKFVVQNEADVIEAMELLGKQFHSDVADFIALKDRIYLMPEGETREKQLEVLPVVYDLAIKYGVSFSPRLHVLRHDNAKAV
jgi:7-carboxy-7-deazaguanine synthase